MDRQIPFEKVNSAMADTFNQEHNHSLVLSVINDLVRMRQNLDNMDEAMNGVSQLKSRLHSIFTTLKSRQYEVPDLLGKAYHEGDNIIVSAWEKNPKMEPGSNRIKRVIRPQISLCGKMVQAATVVIEYNE